MEHQKILSLLNAAGNSKSVTRKWNIVNYQSNANVSVENEIIYRTEVLSGIYQGFPVQNLSYKFFIFF